MENYAGKNVAQTTIRFEEYKDTSDEEEDPCEKCPERPFYPNCDSNFPCPFKAGLDDDTEEEPLEPEGPEPGWQYREKDSLAGTTSYKPEEKALVADDDEEEEPGEDIAGMVD